MLLLHKYTTQTQEQLNATTKEVVRILQNHEDTIKKTTGDNVVMMNYIDMN